MHLSLSQSRERVETYGVPSALGDQPLPAVAARVGEQRRAVAGHLLGHAQRVAASAARRRARARRSSSGSDAHVAAVGEQHVEDVVEELAALAAAEPVATADEGDRLAVDDEAVGRIGVERGGQRRVAVVERQLVARVQPRAPTVLDRQAADPVELALEHPLRGRPAAPRSARPSWVSRSSSGGVDERGDELRRRPIARRRWSTASARSRRRGRGAALPRRAVVAGRGLHGRR